MATPQQQDIATLIGRVHQLQRNISRQQRELLATLAELSDHEPWLDEGARDVAHWAWMQLGVSSWKAQRWVDAGYALEELPAIADAFERCEVGIDKVVELTRFATPDDEEALIPWAREVSAARSDARATCSHAPSRPKPNATDGCRGGTSTMAGGSASKRSSLPPKVRP